MMVSHALALAIADRPGIDVTRGIAAVLGADLAACSLAFLAALIRRPGMVPNYVRLVLVAWILGDVYVAAREAQQIGRPMFLLGLPLALAWEICALAYLRGMWQTTSGLRRRAEW